VSRPAVGAPAPPRGPSPSGLVTFGHGVAEPAALEALLRDAGVRLVVDVRRFPSSRRHPHVNRGSLERWLAVAGIAYRWEERLGGRRGPVAGSPHAALRDQAIRGYADHLGSAAVEAAVADVLEAAHEGVTALMCAETSWRRCHRRLLADRLVLVDGVAVAHLHHDGLLEPHRPSDEVRVEDGRLLYDAGAPTLDL
jgi:uncharacterized protein (DUF488 family)